MLRRCLAAPRCSGAERARARVPLRELLTTLALDVHLGALMFLPPLALGLAASDGWRVWRNPKAYALALGMLVGVGWFAAYHLLAYPGTYQALLDLSAAGARTPLIGKRGDWPQLVSSLVQGFAASSQVQALFILPAALVLGRSPSGRSLLIYCGGLILSFVAVLADPGYAYGIWIMPALDLMLACALAPRLSDLPRATFGTRSLRYIMLICIGGSLFVAQVRAVRDTAPAFPQVLAAVGRAVPAGALVMGAQTYWWAIPDHRYLSWEQLVYYRRVYPGTALADAFAALHPDVFIGMCVDRAVHLGHRALAARWFRSVGDLPGRTRRVPSGACSCCRDAAERCGLRHHLYSGLAAQRTDTLTRGRK